MKYSSRDFLSDVLVVAVVALVGWGAWRAVTPILRAKWQQMSEKAERAMTPLPAGTAVSLDWSITALDGSSVPMKSFKGKVIFLNFWASWCAPCRMEMPNIEKLYAKYKATDVVFLCVATESKSSLEAFLVKHPKLVPVYYTDKIPSSFRVTGIPSTYIISRNAKVALSRSGAVRWDKPQYTAILDRLLQDQST